MVSVSASPPSPPARARSLVAAAVIVGVEGVAGVGAGVAFLVTALAGHPTDRGTAALLGVLVLLLGAAVCVLAVRGVRQGRRWARTPAYLVQFFALIVAWYQRSTLTAVAIAALVVAVAAVVALSWPDSREAFEA